MQALIFLKAWSPSCLFWENWVIPPFQVGHTNVAFFGLSKLPCYSLMLPRYIPQDKVRLMPKITYQQHAKMQTMLKNNLIFLPDATFPDVNRFSQSSQSGRSKKWTDFVSAFPQGTEDIPSTLPANIFYSLFALR